MPDPPPPPYGISRVPEELRNLRLAYSPDLGLGLVDPEVAKICRDAAHWFRDALGAEVRPRPIP
jgi:Asp-tRNA(Asn)/Glu-tRNA(Gln) amidotransferase A subunit family amidase